MIVNPKLQRWIDNLTPAEYDALNTYLATLPPNLQYTALQHLHIKSEIEAGLHAASRQAEQRSQYVPDRQKQLRTEFEQKLKECRDRYRAPRPGGSGLAEKGIYPKRAEGREYRSVEPASPCCAARAACRDGTNRTGWRSRPGGTIQRF